MRETPKKVPVPEAGPPIKAPVQFSRRDVFRNTRPRANPEIDQLDLERSLEAFSRVLGS